MVINLVTYRKRHKALVCTNTERILHNLGELNTRDIIFILEREHNIQCVPHSFHQLVRGHPRIEKVKTISGTNYRLGNV